MTLNHFFTFFKYIMTLFVWVILTATYFHVAKTNVINSDGVANILEARSILNGNIILHGWTLPPDTFYTLDTQIDVIFLWLGLHGITIYYLTPSVIYSSLVMFVYFIIEKITNSKVSAILSVALFIAFPLSLYKTWVLFSPIHLLTILFVTISFYLYCRSDIKNNIFYSSILLYLSIVGDPYAIFIGTLPIILYSSIMFLNTAHKKLDIINRNSYISMTVTSILATVFAKYTVYLIKILGGYTVVNSPLNFVSLNNFGHNFYLFMLSILEVMGSNFFGKTLLSLNTFGDIVHAIIFVLSIYFILSYVLSKASVKKNDLVGLMITSIFLTCIAFLFSTEPVNIETSRYLLDVPIFISIVFGYTISKKDRLLLSFLLFLAIMIAFHFLLAASKERPSSNHNINHVIDFLKINNLTYGLAGYWNAAPFTLLSNNDIKVRQVVVSAKGDVTPFAWLSNSLWYKNTNNFQFIIIGRHNNYGLDKSVVEKNFGNPKQVKDIDGYKIFVIKRERE